MEHTLIHAGAPGVPALLLADLAGALARTVGDLCIICTAFGAGVDPVPAAIAHRDGEADAELRVQLASGTAR